MAENAAIKKILTGLFDGADVPEYSKTPGLRFFDHELKKFQTYDEISTSGDDGKLRAVTFKDIRRVAITVDGKEHFFEKISQNNATGEQIDLVNNKTVDKAASGLKTITWLETDEGGKPVDKEGNPLSDNREAEIYVTFQGYKGDLVSATSQEAAARSGERNDLYSPTAGVASALKTAQGALKERGIEKYNAHVVAHSFGTANAEVAAALLGDKAKDVFLEDPVTASGQLEILKGMSAEKLSAALHITPEEAKVAAGEIQKIEAKTTSRRSVEFDEQGNVRLSNAAMLEVYSGPADAPDKAQKIAANHKKNAGSGNRWTMLGETFTIKNGRDGNALPAVDKKNDMVGKQEYEVISPQTVRENGLMSLAATFDPLHALSNTAHAEQKGAPVYTPEQLQKKGEALKAAAKNKVSQHGSHHLPQLVTEGLMVAGTVAHEIRENAVSLAHTIEHKAEHLAKSLPRDVHHALAAFRKAVTGVAPADHAAPLQPVQVAAKGKPSGEHQV